MNLQQLSKIARKKSEQFAEVLSATSSLLKHHELAKPYKQYLESRLNSYKEITFGYFPPNQYLQLLTDFVDESVLINTGLVYKKTVSDGSIIVQKNFSPLSDHNLILPYHNLYGDIVALVGRSLLPDDEREPLNIPKYKNTKFYKSLNLFGLYKAKQYILDKNQVIIVEGQFDCITCHKFGYNNVVALGGVSLTKYQLQLLMRYTDNIILMLDNDEPGKKATRDIIRKYEKQINIKGYGWAGRAEKDPDELLSKGYQLSDIL